MYIILTSAKGLDTFFFMQKTAYEMRISDWSSDVCSSDLDEIDEQPASWDNLEVRLDVRDTDPDALAARGVRVGCFVAFDAQPVVTDEGFVVSRHLDGKAGVAAALAAGRAIVQSGVELPHTSHILIPIAEEEGQGPSHGLHADRSEGPREGKGRVSKVRSRL